MTTSIREKFESKIAAARAKFSLSPNLNYKPFYTETFLDIFMDFEDEDSKLMVRFIELQDKLKFIPAGNRGSHNKGICGANKHDLARNNIGASNGYRLIYYSEIPAEIHFITMFAKSDQKNLTKDQGKIICAIIEKIKREAAIRKLAI
jgi:hypothetical protein